MTGNETGLIQSVLSLQVLAVESHTLWDRRTQWASQEASRPQLQVELDSAVPGMYCEDSVSREEPKSRVTCTLPP